VTYGSDAAYGPGAAYEPNGHQGAEVIHGPVVHEADDRYAPGGR
jgi:hypothetical protein